MAISPKKFTDLRNRLGISQEALGKLLGVTGKYVGMIERAEKAVEETSSLGLLFAVLESEPATRSFSRPANEQENVLREDEPPYHMKPRSRLVPVIGWAHAGDAASYEQLPDSWQDKVPTECQDVNAFAVRLEGESMEPKFSEGDLLILQPSKEAYSGCLAVCRLVNDGVIFRRVEFTPDAVRLVALNPAYPTDTYPREAFSWIYPVWGRWTQIWK